MKKVSTILATSLVLLTLAACGNGNEDANNSNQDQAATSSKTAVTNKTSRKSTGNTQQSIQNSKKATGTSQNKLMTTSQVIARVAQLKHVNLNGGDKIFVTPTSTPNVFKIYIKGANQDPQVDSIADHYVYNGNTDVISQATER